MSRVINTNELDLAAYVRDGDTLMWGQATAEPVTLTGALVAQRAKLGQLRVLVGIDQSGTLTPECGDHFSLLSYCGAGGNSRLIEAGVLEVIPIPYFQLATLIGCETLAVDVLLVQVSEADEHGYHSLGLANDLLIPALTQVRVIIAEVNPGVPYTWGARRLHESEIDVRVIAEAEPLEAPVRPASMIEAEIATHVAELIEDGSNLQLGLGGIANQVLSLLTDRRDIGIHSGIVGDGLVDLAESGALTNARKAIDTGVSITGLLMGSQRLYRFARCNPQLQLRGSDYTHAPQVLGSIDRFVAINSAIEVDLTGQVNSEVAAGKYVGAVGGAPDFMRAAAISRGGLPIIAMPSMAGACSRIVAGLSGPVTTPRCDAGLIITEHGVADLRGLCLRARTRKLLDIASPEQRESLERQWFELSH